MQEREMNLQMPVCPEKIQEFETYLYEQERSANTIAKYVRDLRLLFSFVNGKEFSKGSLMDWKEQLTSTYAPASVNSMLTAANTFFDWIGLSGLKVKPLKIQREIFMKPEKELTREEYFRLIKAADQGQNERLALLLKTICSTGIRVSELCHITVAALQTGRALVVCKGKNRTVFLPVDLCRALRRYCREQRIESGVIFRTKTGKPLDRSNIWRDMKALSARAGVEPGKVFPHNLRHLFARTYYRLEKDISRLADLLGHSSVNTTRIYTMESGVEHARQLERMGLVSLQI